MILSFAQVRQMLGISDSTLRRLLRRGDLRAYRIGRQWRFEEDDLREYFAAHANCADSNRVIVPANAGANSITKRGVFFARAVPDADAEVMP